MQQQDSDEARAESSPINHALAVLKTALQNNDEDSKDVGKAIQALEITLNHFRTDSLACAVRNADSVETLVGLWNILEAEMTSVISCRFTTPSASQQSSTSSSTASSPKVGPTELDSSTVSPGSPRSQRSTRRSANIPVAQFPVTRDKKVVATVLERDGHSCIVTKALSKEKAKSLKSANPNVIVSPLEVAHIISFSLARYIPRFSDYLLDKAIKDVIGNGIGIDNPINCVTLAKSIHHKCFGDDWWITAETVDGVLEYRAEVGETAQNTFPLCLLNLDGTLINFPPERVKIWPSPLLCNVAARFGRVQHALAAAGLYELHHWRDDSILAVPSGDRFLVESSIEATLSESSTVDNESLRKLREYATDLNIPYLNL